MTKNNGKRVSVRQLGAQRIKDLEEEVAYFKENVLLILKEIERLKCQVQEFEAIGTIDEFKALKEKSVAKKPIQDEHFQHDYSCPCCGGKLAESVDDNCCLEEEMAGWCPYCGQKLDWQ